MTTVLAPPRRPQSQRVPSTVAQNARVVVPIAVAQSVLYFVLNHWPPTASHLLPLTAIDTWVPFWPWTVWPYLVLMLAPAPLALLVRRRTVFRQTLTAYISAMCATFVVFAVWPTHYPRADSVVDDFAYRLLMCVDTAECCFPSGHIVAPAVVCWALWRDGRRWPLLLLPLFSLTILTTKQHYLWDGLGGFAFAAAVIALSRVRISPRRGGRD
jgi:hypothetical protein